MKTLKEVLESFKLSKETRDAILKEKSIKAPKEFKEVAEVVLAGHFEVKGNGKVVKVYPTCVEFYYHEEQEGGIKDYIVYHRNKDKIEIKNKDIQGDIEPVEVFPIGLLNNHQSGIDITFEHESPKGIIRASMLIREYSVDKGNGKLIKETRSTYIYYYLYQRSLFNNLSVEWIDGEKEVDVTPHKRKNVAYFDDNGNRTDKKDLRQWQFKVAK